MALLISFVFPVQSGAGFLDDVKEAVTSEDRVKDLKKERAELRQEVARLKKENEALKRARRNPPLVRMSGNDLQAFLFLPELTDGDREDYMDGTCTHPWELLAHNKRMSSS